jgi:hypothetical protein
MCVFEVLLLLMEEERGGEEEEEEEGSLSTPPNPSRFVPEGRCESARLAFTRLSTSFLPLKLILILERLEHLRLAVRQRGRHAASHWLACRFTPRKVPKGSTS